MTPPRNRRAPSAEKRPGYAPTMPPQPSPSPDEPPRPRETTSNRRRVPPDARTGLLIHGGAIGDFVMSLRIVQAMRQAGLDQVAVLGRPDIVSAAIPDGGVDEVLDLDRGGFHALFTADSQLPPAGTKKLSAFAVAVDMLGGPGSISCRRLREAGVSTVIGIDPRPRRDWHGHVSDQWLADLRAAGTAAAPGPPAIRVPDPLLRLARERLQIASKTSGRRIAVIHPGSGSVNKCWPLSDFLELARRLAETEFAVVFLVGPVEAERFGQSAMKELAAVAPLVADRPLVEARDLLAAADLFVSNDSGMSHLAAALGTPTLAIFGPTEPRLWSPLGPRVSCLRSTEPDRWPTAADVTAAASSLAVEPETALVGVGADCSVSSCPFRPRFRRSTGLHMPALEIRPALLKELRTVLRLSLAMPDQTSAELEGQVTGFIRYARELGLDLSRQWLALVDGRLVAACTCIESPGRTAVLLLPSGRVTAAHVQALAGLVGHVAHLESNRDIRLLQCLIEPRDDVNQRVLAEAGFEELATLLYLEWTAAEQKNAAPTSLDAKLAGRAIEWTTYSRQCHADFTELIAATYQDSLDCRRLSGIRDIEDVVAGHKATGRFDPHRWLLLRCDGEAVGCILLAENPIRRALELVYTGVRPHFRRQGVGRCLLARGLAMAREERFAAVTLAVDACNVPALAMYRSFGFRATHSRVAMIRAPV